MRCRNQALLNGALITVGALAVLDNVVVHWLLGLHRAVPAPELATPVEVALAALGGVLLAVGLWREYRGRHSHHGKG
jgi:membrane protein implicated in regulation of membrane protease activity